MILASRISAELHGGDEKGLQRPPLPFARHHERGQEGADEGDDKGDQPRYQYQVLLLAALNHIRSTIRTPPAPARRPDGPRVARARPAAPRSRSARGWPRCSRRHHAGVAGCARPPAPGVARNPPGCAGCRLPYAAASGLPPRGYLPPGRSRSSSSPPASQPRPSRPASCPRERSPGACCGYPEKARSRRSGSARWAGSRRSPGCSCRAATGGVRARQGDEAPPETAVRMVHASFLLARRHAQSGARALDHGDEGTVHVGSLLASCRRTSSGVPSASRRPASWMTIRSQYSASSMKCVVMTTVVPAAASSVICRQKARRASGSMPLVGSSRKRMSGSWSKATAMARRCL